MPKISKKSLIENIKILKANHKSLNEFAKEKYVDENGVAHIHVYVDKNTIYNPLTNPSSPDISDDIIDYIDSESHFIPAEYPMEIDIHSNDDLDEKYVESKLKQHYWKQLADKYDDLKNNRIIAATLFVVGLLMLGLYFVLESIPAAEEFFNEIFSIIASFLLWEAIDYALINGNALKIEYLNVAQLALVNVIIKNKEKAQ